MQNVMKKLFLLLLVLAALSAQAERKFLTSAPHPQTGQVKTWSYEADEITTGDVFSVMVYLDGQQYGRWNVTGCARDSHGRFWITWPQGGASLTQEWHTNGSTIGNNIAFGVCLFGLIGRNTK